MDNIKPPREIVFMHERVLAKQYKIFTILISGLLLTSLYFNIMALITPFLKIRYLYMHSMIYSLPATISMMWGFKLYVVTVLIVGFSVVFPFVKLFFLFYIYFFIRKPKTRFWTIVVIESLAKWSMLDVFIVCIILVLTNNQYILSSTPKIGIYYFLLAISLSIVCSMIVDYLCEKTYPDYHKKVDGITRFTSNRFSVVEKSIIIFLIIVSIVTFVFSIQSKFIIITQTLLKPNVYSIIDTCISLKKISPILALFTTVVLIVAPIIIYNFVVIFWITAYHPSFHIKMMNLFNKFSKLMMLDVFCLSLYLFLWEGKAIIKTELREGLYVLVYFVFISFMIPLLIKWYSILRFKFYLLNKKGGQ